MGKLPFSLCIAAKKKIKILSTRFGLSLYNAQIGKSTKIPSIPIIHEGQNGKKSQKGSQMGVKRAKNQEAFSHCAKISHPSAKFSIFQLFLLFFPSGF